MKNKLICISLSMVLSLPVSVLAVDNNVYTEVPVFEEIAEPINAEPSDNTSQLDEDLVQTEDVQQTPGLPYKEPITKQTLIKMFLKAMLAVGISCIILYAALSAYNKLRGIMSENNVLQNKAPNSESILSTPTDLESAVRKFLEKTKWK